jgi:hypothetical protein
VAIFSDNLVAAKDVGIADAVPDKTVYLTTGNPKTIIFGKNTIKIKKATWPVAAVAKSSAAVRGARVAGTEARIACCRQSRKDRTPDVEAGAQRARFVCGIPAKVDATCGARVVRRPDAQATNTGRNEKRTTLKITAPPPECRRRGSGAFRWARTPVVRSELPSTRRTNLPFTDATLSRTLHPSSFDVKVGTLALRWLSCAAAAL